MLEPVSCTQCGGVGEERTAARPQPHYTTSVAAAAVVSCCPASQHSDLAMLVSAGTTLHLASPLWSPLIPASAPNISGSRWVDGLKEEACTMLPLPWSNNWSYGWKLDLDRTYCYSTLNSRSPPISSLSYDTKASKDVQERNGGFYFVAINTILWYFNPITVWSLLTTTMNRWIPPRRRYV